MKIVAMLVGAAIVLVAVGSHAQRKTDPALDKLAVEFEAAFNARDASKIASMYTDDAVLMPPGEPMIKGRTNIEAHYRRAFRGTFSDMKVLPFESMTSGTLAFEAGVSTLVVPGPDGRSRTPAGKYVIVYKRVGSGWKIAYDVFSNDEPEPQPPK
jgi:uncharacterized protein (TIGR02246 family)